MIRDYQGTLQEIDIVELSKNYIKIKGNDYSYAIFNLCLSKNRPTEKSKLDEIIQKEFTNPRLKELEEIGVIRLENGLIKPTSLGLKIYEVFKK
ncbi:hypothetical protein GF352_04480 [archaeon]|nr:hypothetical protein [archaeon]